MLILSINDLKPYPAIPEGKTVAFVDKDVLTWAEGSVIAFVIGFTWSKSH